MRSIISNFKWLRKGELLGSGNNVEGLVSYKWRVFDEEVNLRQTNNEGSFMNI